MKKFGLCLSIFALCFAGCDGGDEGWDANDYCSYQYQILLDEEYDFSSLSEEMQDELRKVFMESCKGFVNGYPECKSEFLDNAECWSGYSDEEIEKHEDEWHAVEADCRDNARNDDGNIDDDKFYACIIDKKLQCAKARKAAEICESQNTNVLKNYENKFNEAGGLIGPLEDKLSFWGKNPNDYRKKLWH